MSGTVTRWYVAVNAFYPGHDGYGTVLSSHKTLDAAEDACRNAQPKTRGSYLPTKVVLCDTRYARGEIIRTWGHYPLVEGFASAEDREAWLSGANGMSDRGISGFQKAR